MRTIDEETKSRIGKDFYSKGYAIVEDFLEEDEIQLLRQQATRLIKEESTKGEHGIQIFSSDNNSRSLYFLNSGDKIRYFFEKDAFTKKEGNKFELLVPEEQSLAKIGHALHYLNEPYRLITTASQIQDVFRAIHFQAPTVAQSMVIFKNPKVGGAYTPHQDATFLCTDPIHLAGVWLALDNATPENGCLEFIPGSQTDPLHRRSVRTGKKEDGELLLDWTKPPKQYHDSQFVVEPVKKGALVLIHGLVVHRSAPNISDKPRWVYTFHVFDKKRCKYSEDNWLQTGKDPNTFLTLYELS